MKFAFIGRGGLLSSIVLQHIIKCGHKPDIVLLEDVPNTQYPNICEIICKIHNIKYRISQSVQDDNNIKYISKNNIQFAIVASLSEILSADFLKLTAFYNVHMGVLPYYRGAFTNFWKIKNGDDVYGITIHEMTEKVDNGSILLIKERDFTDITDGFNFTRLNYQMAAETTVELLQQIQSNSVKSILTSSEKGTYYRKYTPEDLEISISEDALKNFKIINRLQYYGTPYILLDGEKHTIASANLLFEGNANTDTSFKIMNNRKALLSNASGILELNLINTK